MSLWDRARAALGMTKSSGDVAVEDDRIILRELERAKSFPQEAPDCGPAEIEACKRCQGPLRRVVFTTAGGGAQLAIWRAHPMAMDGWVCAKCGWSAMPRHITVDESVAYGSAGAEHAQNGRFEDAEFWFRRIIGSWPAYPPGYADLGQLSLARSDATKDVAEKQRHRADAERWLRRAVDGDSRSAILAVRIPLARVIALAGHEREALALLDTLLADAPADAKWRDEAEELATGIRAGRALFTRATEMVADVILQPMAVPLAASARTRCEKAATLLRKAEKRDSSFATLWYLGKVELRMGNLEAAVAALEAAHAANPNQPDGCRELGSVYLELDRAADALPIIRRALDLRPDDATLRCNLAVVLLLTGDIESSKTEVTKAARAEPDDPITRGVANLIDDVACGRRKRPRSIAEAEGRKPGATPR